MTITTTIIKSYGGYSVIARDENHAAICAYSFSSRLDAENAKALVEMATAKLTGKKPAVEDRHVQMLAQAITDCLHSIR